MTLVDQIEQLGAALDARLANPYWDDVAPHVTTNRHGEVEVESYLRPVDAVLRRTALTDRYAWTISDPATVAFVTEHAGAKVIDPLAGTGYWAFLLMQAGADVLAFDSAPPDATKNHYHPQGVTYTFVEKGDAVASVARFGEGRTLLLSWPPYSEPLGFDVISAFAGDRIVYIGEGEGGCCGDDDMFALLDREWTQVAQRRPVQFAGMHDYVTVYVRKASA